MGTFENYAPGYKMNWERMKVRLSRQVEVDKIVDKIISLRPRYEKCVSLLPLGPPWWFYALVHYREANFRFDRFLGNGQLLSKKTTIVPIGEGPFPSFEEGAKRAMEIKGWINVSDWSIERTCWRLESYNGFGYHGKGVNSPYLYGGSTVYGPPEAKAGKYVADHVFDPKHVDTQLGTVTILKDLAERLGLVFGDTPKGQIDDQIEVGGLWVQQSLNTLGATPPLVEDGIIGPKTMGMISRFQKENGLEQTGLPNAATIKEIEEHLKNHNAPPPPEPEPFFVRIFKRLFGG